MSVCRYFKINLWPLYRNSSFPFFFQQAVNELSDKFSLIYVAASTAEKFIMKPHSRGTEVVQVLNSAAFQPSKCKARVGVLEGKAGELSCCEKDLDTFSTSAMNFDKLQNCTTVPAATYCFIVGKVE